MGKLSCHHAQYLNSLACYYSDSGDGEKNSPGAGVIRSLEVVVRRQMHSNHQQSSRHEREIPCPTARIAARKQSRNGGTYCRSRSGDGNFRVFYIAENISVHRASGWGRCSRRPIGRQLMRQASSKDR